MVKVYGLGLGLGLPGVDLSGMVGRVERDAEEEVADIEVEGQADEAADRAEEDEHLAAPRRLVRVRVRVRVRVSHAGCTRGDAGYDAPRPPPPLEGPNSNPTNSNPWFGKVATQAEPGSGEGGWLEVASLRC